jgi:hypothetical protein
VRCVISWGTSCVLIVLWSLSAVSAPILVPNDYSQIQGAVDASSTGDTIQVTVEDDYEAFYEGLFFLAISSRSPPYC